VAQEDDPVADLIGRLRDTDLPAGSLVGEFRVEAKLGEGGMAAVFSAVHPVVGKRAAVKVISRRLCADQHAVERFVQEARTVHQIAHPNIVDTFGFGTLPDGRCYFLMEWLNGESLADRLRKGSLGVFEALDILIQTAEALKAAHEAGVVHRDLKPDNVFVDESRTPPSVKLLDFGIAKLAAADVTLPRTRSGTAMGTPGYMSPEQARGRNVDGKTDVYALGCMTFEMVLGRLPFEGESAIDILAKHLAEPPPVPSALWREVPARFERLILSMLEKDPAARPAMGEVLRTLVELRRGPITDRMAPVPRWRARWPLAVAAVAVAASAVALLTIRPSPEQPPAPVAAPAPVRAPVVTPPPTAPPATGVLVIHADAPDAVVHVDGQPLPPDGKMRFDASGVHAVTVTAPHRRRETRQVEVLLGRTVELDLHLSSTTPKRPANSHDKKKPPGSGDYTLDPFKR
jgi:tRNA A-37 threonylcarbamoyl transferase component Bud32